MLEDASKKAFGSDADGVAIEVESLNLDLLVAWNKAVDISNTQTPLIVLDDFSFAFGDFWINKMLEGSVCLVLEAATNNHNTHVYINLNRS